MIYVDRDKCDGCGLCVDACPHSALKLVDGAVEVDLDRCQETGTCLEICPRGALLEVTEAGDPEVSTLEKAPTSMVEQKETRVSRRQSSATIVPWVGAAIQFLVTDVVPQLWHAWVDNRQGTRRGSSRNDRRMGNGTCQGPRRQRRRRQQGRRT
jgi:ferredoxin